MEKVKAEILIVMPNDAGVDLLVQAENGESGTISVRSKKFNETSRQFEDDADTFNAGLELLQSLGATSFETAPVEIAGLSQYADGTDIEVYTKDGRVSFKPIQSFVRYSNLDASTKRQLDKETSDFRASLPITEWDEHRFNLGFKVMTKDGEKVFRASQIQYYDEEAEAERNVGLKTVTKKTSDIRETLREDRVAEPLIQQVQDAFASMQKHDRAETIEALNKVLGVDFEADLLSGKYLLNASLRPQTISNPDGNSYWLVAYIDPSEGIVVPNPDYTEE